MVARRGSVRRKEEGGFIASKRGAVQSCKQAEALASMPRVLPTDSSVVGGHLGLLPPSHALNDELNTKGRVLSGPAGCKTSPFCSRADSRFVPLPRAIIQLAWPLAMAVFGLDAATQQPRPGRRPTKPGNK